MMKKEYIKPKLTVVEVETQNLMALSAHETPEVLSRENDWDFSIYEDNNCEWGYSDSNNDDCNY